VRLWQHRGAIASALNVGAAMDTAHMASARPRSSRRPSPSAPAASPTRDRQPLRRDDGEYVRALERGLAVLKAFNARTPAMSMTQVAERAQLTRAVARRYLFTLEALGYVVHNDGLFRLTPRVLDFGFTYLGSTGIGDVAQPFMERIVATLRESCSVGVLDGADVVYVARVTADRIMTTNLVVGSRLPAHATSMGKVLLAFEPPARLAAYFASTRLRQLTDRTIADEATLRAVLDGVRRRGWATNDEESEKGVRTVSVPLRDRSGNVVAAINLSGHASRVSMRELKRDHLPVLLDAARDISRALGARDYPSAAEGEVETQD
jgi:IclR family pca regulon transcriptional regulator